MLFVILPSCTNLLRGPYETEDKSDTFYQWTVTLGRDYDDRGHDIKVDSHGQVYVAGHFSVFADLDPFDGMDYQKTTEETRTTHADIFISSIDRYQGFFWSDTFGPWAENDDNEDNVPVAIAVDEHWSAFPNFFITGYFENNTKAESEESIYVTVGESEVLVSNGAKDIFLSRYESIGRYVWTKTIGGSADEVPTDIATDDEGSIYVLGLFKSTTVDFDPNPTKERTAVVQKHSGSEYDTFVWKLDQHGNLIWVLTYEGAALAAAPVGGYGIAVDPFGNAYITGCFAGTRDFDPSEEGVFELTSDGVDIFVTKISRYGDFEWAIRKGSSASLEYGSSIALSPAGFVYVTGVYGDDDLFVMKLDQYGNDIWGDIKLVEGIQPQTFDSNDPGGRTQIEVDDEENVYLVGRFKVEGDFDPSRDEPEGVGQDIHTPVGGWDIFITKINQSGFFEWTVTAGGSGNDIPLGLDIDDEFDLFITGFFDSPEIDFDPTEEGIDLKASKGKQDVFIMKLSPKNK